MRRTRKDAQLERLVRHPSQSFSFCGGNPWSVPFFCFPSFSLAPSPSSSSSSTSFSSSAAGVAPASSCVFSPVCCCCCCWCASLRALLLPRAAVAAAGGSLPVLPLLLLWAWLPAGSASTPCCGCCCCRAGISSQWEKRMALQPQAPLGAHRVEGVGAAPTVQMVPAGGGRETGGAAGAFQREEDAARAAFVQQLPPCSCSRVALGLYHTLAVGVKRDDVLPQLYVWGRNHSNVLGLGIENRERVFPGVVPFFARRPVYAVACGTSHSVVLIGSDPTLAGSAAAAGGYGKLYAFGLGNRGRLGFPKTPAGSSSRQRRDREYAGDDEDDGAGGPEEGGGDQWLDPQPETAVGEDEGEAELPTATRGREGGGRRRGRRGGGRDEDEEEEEDAESTWFTPRPVRVRFPVRKTKIVRISCGADHTLALTDRGHLYAWGAGTYGNLGLGDARDVYRPERVEFPRSWKDSGSSNSSTGLRVTACAAGARHSLACTNDGTLWAWGHGGQGRLGLGHSRSSLLPVVVEHMQAHDVVYVAAGDAHSACIDRQGRLYTWGDGGYGKLGHGADGELPLPRKVEGFGGLPVLQVACGTFHTLAVTHPEGAVYAWGAGLALGFGEGLESLVLAPRRVSRIEVRVLQVAAGAYHSAAITVDADLLVWGVSGLSRLGHGDRQDQPSPKFVADLRSRMYVKDLQRLLAVPVRRSDLQKDDDAAPADSLGEGGLARTLQQLSCGGSHTAAVMASGDVWVWGSNEAGQLGLGEEIEEDQYEPVELKAFKTPIRWIACGGSHTLAIAHYGDVFAWGRNDHGQLGIGVKRPAYRPEGIAGLRQAVRVYAGEDFSGCITQVSSTAGGAGSSSGRGMELGDLWMWGAADGGKLGLGEAFTAGAVFSPQRVELLPMPVSACALGSSHTLVVAASGACFAWGAGFFGRLGTGSTANAYTPTKVSFPRGVRLRDVAAGEFHSMALSLQGDLWVWGRKDDVCGGENYLKPKIFMQLEGPAGVPRVQCIAAAGRHSLAVTEDGNVFAWGSNENFESGCGKKAADHLDRPEMVSLPHDNPALWVVTGRAASFFVLQSGDVFAAGAVKGGRLGVGWGKRAHQPEPAPVKTHWRDFAAAAAALPQLALEDDAAAATDIVDGARGQPSSLARPLLELPEKAVDDFLCSLHYGFDAGGREVGWRELQQLLQQEEFENRPEYIQQLEDDIIAVSGRELDYVLTLREKEAELRAVEAQFQAKVLKLASETKFDLPSTNVKDTLSAVSSKLLEFQDLVWCLQQQPAYLLRLFGSLRRRWQIDAIAELATQIYYEIEDSRTLHLFAALMRALAVQEAERAESLGMCFNPEASALVPLFKEFALRSTNLAPFAAAVLDVRNPSSVASVLAGFEEVVVTLSPEELALYNGMDAGAAIGPSGEHLRSAFHEGLKLLRQTMTTLLFGTVLSHVPLRPALRGLLRYATKAVFQREFPMDYDCVQLGPELAYCRPTVTLLLHGLIQPVFEDPLLYANQTGCPPLTAGVVQKLQACARLIAYCSTPAGADPAEDEMSSALLIRALGVEMWAAAAQAVRFQAECRETLDIDLTMDIFEACFDLREHTVTLRAETLCSTANLCKKYEANLNMSAHDPVAALIRKISEGRNPPFSEDQLVYCRQHQTWHSFVVKHRFLLTEKNVVFDQATHAPVPQQMAYRQRAVTKDRHRLMSVLLRYTPPDPYDPRLVLQQTLREVPPVQARDWSQLQQQFQGLQAYFVACDPPDFERGKLCEKAAQVAFDFARSRTDQRAVLQWVAAGILERKQHRAYLHHVVRRQDGLAALKREYETRTKRQVEDLKLAIKALDELKYPQSIAFQAKRAGFPLWFYVIRRKRKKQGGGAKSSDGVPTATFRYGVLYQRNIIKQLSTTVPQEIYGSIFFTFTRRKSQEWQMIVTQRERNADRHWADVVISQEELLSLRQLPPQASYGFLKSAHDADGFVVVEVLPFLQMLGEIEAASAGH